MKIRSDYMNGKCTHAEYYSDIVDAIGGPSKVDLPFSIARIKAALAAGDEHLNTLPLSMWDGRVSGLHGASAALKKRGDFLSLGTGVCILKQAARMLAEATK